MARLLDPASPGHAKQPPTLLDVRLIGMSPSAFSLSGFERVDGVEYAQSWLIQDTAQLRVGDPAEAMIARAGGGSGPLPAEPTTESSAESSVRPQADFVDPVTACLKADVAEGSRVLWLIHVASDGDSRHRVHVRCRGLCSDGRACARACACTDLY